jgi:hypothetical protein
MNESKKTFKRARVTTSRTVLRLYYPVQLSKIEHEERDFADDICRFFQLEQFYMEGMMLLYMRAKQYLLTPFRYNLIAAFTVTVKYCGPKVIIAHCIRLQHINKHEQQRNHRIGFNLTKNDLFDIELKLLEVINWQLFQ